MILLPDDLPEMTRAQERHPSWVEPAAFLSEARGIPRQWGMRNIVRLTRVEHFHDRE